MEKICVKKNRKIWRFLFLKEKTFYIIKLRILLKNLEETDWRSLFHDQGKQCSSEVGRSN